MRPEALYFRDRHQEVDWADIIGFRNIAVHAYFSVEWPIVWETAIGDMPALRTQIKEMLTDIKDGA